MKFDIDSLNDEQKEALFQTEEVERQDCSPTGFVI